MLKTTRGHDRGTQLVEERVADLVEQGRRSLLPVPGVVVSGRWSIDSVGVVVSVNDRLDSAFVLWSVAPVVFPSGGFGQNPCGEVSRGRYNAGSFRHDMYDTVVICHVEGDR